jgi:hypothetical protein
VPEKEARSMRAELFIDPACPWTWITSRWLCEVREHRPLDLRWRPFSLLLDDTLADISLARRLELASSTRVLRLIEAVRARYGEPPIDELYTRIGTGFHHDDQRDFEHLEAVLVAMGIPATMLAHLDDPRWDQVIHESMAEAHAVAGPEAGVPLLVMHGDGPRRAFLGPVFSPAPTGLAALSAWDGLVTLLAAPGFFELKRHRDTEPALPVRPAVEPVSTADLSGTV